MKEQNKIREKLKANCCNPMLDSRTVAPVLSSALANPKPVRPHRKAAQSLTFVFQQMWIVLRCVGMRSNNYLCQPLVIIN
jgi:hypothetical protein